MGLLDDAIREHLELKRAHGADPTEVERQEREAFGAAQRRAADAAMAQATAAGVTEFSAEGPEAVTETPVSEIPNPRPDPFPEPDPLPQPDPIPDPAPLPEPTVERGAPEPEFAADGQEPEESEDVLEETPEFLQETPEHDRLWFEQRPPRDFDF